MAQRKHAELIKQWADDDSLVIEIFSDGVWKVSEAPCFLDNCEYRIKPTKPSIDWSQVADEYVQMATDANGYTFLYQKGELVKTGYSWSHRNSALLFSSAFGFKSYNPGTCDWKDSLVQRPAKDGEE